MATKWIRAYVSKPNGDHDRVVDMEISDSEVSCGTGPDDRGRVSLSAAGAKKMGLKKGETAEYAELTFPDQAVTS